MSYLIYKFITGNEFEKSKSIKTYPNSDNSLLQKQPLDIDEMLSPIDYISTIIYKMNNDICDIKIRFSQDNITTDDLKLCLYDSVYIQLLDDMMILSEANIKKMLDMIHKNQYLIHEDVLQKLIRILYNSTYGQLELDTQQLLINMLPYFPIKVALYCLENFKINFTSVENLYFIFDSLDKKYFK